MLVQPNIPMAYSFLPLMLFSCIIYTNILACNQTERNSLMSFSLTLSSPPLNWTSNDCCNWEGITCNQDGSVTHLCLPSKGLKLEGGMFPSSLANLTHLTHLNFSNNSLYGSLDQKGSFLSSLNRLQILDLSYNHLTGKLPLSLPSSDIRMVDLSHNYLQGKIPSSFFQKASNLTSFNVSNNAFSGSIPSSICLFSSTSIRLLDFSSNKFSGNISSGLGECSKLQVYRAGHNNLSGLLPQDIYNAKKLEEIALPLNSLHGAISDRIVNLSNLVILDLYFNHFSGILPLYVGKLSKLKLMRISHNNLEGSLPPSLMNCTNLEELHLTDNNLEGDISELNFTKLSQLSKVDLMMNHFSGNLPMSLYSCKFLKALRLSLNHLEGQIQPEILSLKSLSFLSLGGNNLTNVTGAIRILMGCKSLEVLLLPSTYHGEEMPSDNEMVDFDGFQNLRLFEMGGCELSGQIPVWLSKLKKLEILALGSNRLTGSIPCWLATLPRLFYISLAGNLISGEIPRELCKLPMLVSAAQVDRNDNDTKLSLFYGGAQYQRYQNKLSYIPPAIYLGNNHISGTIPTKIGQLHLLHVLDLSANNLFGKIPDEISELKNLESLDLSENNLSGIMPVSFGTLSFLRFFNVSHNNLQGPIPKGTQLQSFNASAFEGNSKLCGAPLPKECRSTNCIDAKNKKIQNVHNAHRIPWSYIPHVLGFITGFWGVCGSLMLKNTWRYAYFRFLDNVQDRLHLKITVCMIKMQRKLGR